MEVTKLDYRLYQVFEELHFRIVNPIIEAKQDGGRRKFHQLFPVLLLRFRCI